MPIHKTRIMLARIWNSRPCYKTFSDMPSWLLVLFGLISVVEASYWGWAIETTVPLYYQAAVKAQHLGALGMLLGCILLALFSISWFFGNTAIACNSELKRRHFK